jgi:hypothetical protein
MRLRKRLRILQNSINGMMVILIMKVLISLMMKIVMLTLMMKANMLILVLKVMMPLFAMTPIAILILIYLIQYFGMVLILK